MALIDIHAHLTDKRYEGQLADVLERSRQAGVDGWITVGTNVADSLAAVVLAEDIEQVSCVVGVHPHASAEAERGYCDELKRLAAKEVVCGIGEIGLDYHYDFSDRISQRRVFQEQLSLAIELALPVVVHCREAFEDCWPILKELGMAGRKVVFHSFAGNKAMAKKVLDGGYFISFTGMVTFDKAADIQDAARYVPANRLLIETDCPYLTPAPKRKIKLNEPAMLIHIARKLAQLRDVDVEEIAQATSENSRLFFS